jgi:hypothetical protein
MQKQYKEAVKQRNLSRSFVEMGKQLRQELDEAGATYWCSSAMALSATAAVSGTLFDSPPLPAL